MKRDVGSALISTSSFFITTLILCQSAGAQMGNTSISTGISKIKSHKIHQPIPEVRAKALEGIQPHSVVTGGGFVTQGEVLLPQSPSLDRRDRLHDSIKHPYETIPSLQNVRLDLVH